MQIYSVSEFVHGINELLTGIPACVQGEVSNFHVAQNRFIWFELKDEKSFVSCFMMTFQLDQRIEDGMEIQVIGRPGLFAKSGRFHLRVNKIQVMGKGSLRRQYELLKEQLTKEGLFDPARKRPLPKFPGVIGLVTSPDAAAYSDVLRILKNRWTGLRLVHFPVNVQGDEAVPSLVKAFQQINAHFATKLDLVIITRGGGSMEDLQSFNNETVVRAVFALKVPSIAAIGHERDVTLVEYAADLRAATPSNAAELAVPDKRDVIYQINTQIKQQRRDLAQLLEQYRQRVNASVTVLDDQVAHYTLNVQAATQNFLLQARQWQNSIQSLRQKIDHQQALLHSLNPKHVLRRGYSITTTAAGTIVTSVRQLTGGQPLTTQLADGQADSQVTSVTVK